MSYRCRNKTGQSKSRRQTCDSCVTVIALLRGLPWPLYQLVRSPVCSTVRGSRAQVSAQPRPPPFPACSTSAHLHAPPLGCKALALACSLALALMFVRVPCGCHPGEGHLQCAPLPVALRLAVGFVFPHSIYLCWASCVPGCLTRTFVAAPWTALPCGAVTIHHHD